MLAQLITATALGVFVARCLLLLVRTATVSHHTRYISLIKRCFFTVAKLCAPIRSAVVRLHHLIAEQIHMLVLAADNPVLRRRAREPIYDRGGLGSDATATSRSHRPLMLDTARHDRDRLVMVDPGSAQMSERIASHRSR